MSTISCKPGIQGMAAATSSRMAAGAPFSRATRLRRLSANSSLPCMAAAVTAATCSPTPARRAISSMHSIWIAVESMSITSNPGAPRVGKVARWQASMSHSCPLRASTSSGRNG